MGHRAMELESDPQSIQTQFLLFCAWWWMAMRNKIGFASQAWVAWECSAPSRTLYRSWLHPPFTSRHSSWAHGVQHQEMPVNLPLLKNSDRPAACQARKECRWGPWSLVCFPCSCRMAVRASRSLQSWASNELDHNARVDIWGRCWTKHLLGS